MEDKFKIIIKTEVNGLGETRYYPYVHEKVRVFFGLLPKIKKYIVNGGRDEYTSGYLWDSGKTSTFKDRTNAIESARYAICQVIKDRKKEEITHTEITEVTFLGCGDK